LQPRLLVIGLLNISAGIPVLLKAGTLAAWLNTKGIDYTTIGLFGIVGIPYSFRFVWAPFVDRMPIPYLTRIFGRRRSWLIATQLALMASLIAFANVEPAENIWLTFSLMLVVSFLGATQWIVVLAYQMETLPKREYGPSEGIGVLGYRIGMNLIGGYLALMIAGLCGWGISYMTMALCIGVGLITVLCIAEPDPIVSEEAKYEGTTSWLYGAVWCPLADFFKRPGWLACLLVMFFYRMGDNIIGNMTNVFYQDLGFTLPEIANASKLFGMGATITGGLIGGHIVAKLGFLRSMLMCSVIHGLANIMYVVLAYSGHDVDMLYISIAIENITGGMRMSALLAYQMTLCNPAYAATQISLLGSFVSLGYHILSLPSGWLAEHLGWVNLFSLSVASTIPVAMLIVYLMRISGETIFIRNRVAYSARTLT